MEAAEVETRQLLQKLFPKVSLPSNMVREVALLHLLLGVRELWSCCAVLECFLTAPLYPKVFAVGRECLLLVMPVLAWRSEAADELLQEVLKEQNKSYYLVIFMPQYLIYLSVLSRGSLR